MYILTKVEEAFCPETYFYSNSRVGEALRDMQHEVKYHTEFNDSLICIAKNLPDGESHESTTEDMVSFSMAKHHKRLEVALVVHNRYGEVEKFWKLDYVNPNQYKH